MRKRNASENFPAPRGVGKGRKREGRGKRTYQTFQPQAGFPYGAGKKGSENEGTEGVLGAGLEVRLPVEGPGKRGKRPRDYRRCSWFAGKKNETLPIPNCSHAVKGNEGKYKCKVREGGKTGRKERDWVFVSGARAGVSGQKGQNSTVE